MGRPSCTIVAEGSSSPDSFRAEQVAATEGVGHKRPLVIRIDRNTLRAAFRPRPERGRVLDFCTALPYIGSMHTVALTGVFLADAEHAGLTQDELDHIVSEVSREPYKGDLMVGTGGARKRRFGAGGKGKRGGIRVVSYFAGEDVPVFLLAVINKGERDNLSKAERNELRKELARIAEDYRAGQQQTTTELTAGRSK